MLHAPPAASLAHARLSRARPLHRIVHLVRQTFRRGDGSRGWFGRSTRPPAGPWTVTGTLVCQTPFAALTTRICVPVSARTEDEALRLAAAEITASYPGYVLATVTAASGPPG